MKKSLALLALLPLTALAGMPAPTTKASAEAASKASVTANSTNSSVSSATSGDSSSANDYTNRSFAIGLSAPIPIQVRQDCYLPKHGLFGRGQSWIGGLAVSLTPVLERDEKCIQDIHDEWAHQEKMLELQIEAQKAATNRIMAETALRKEQTK